MTQTATTPRDLNAANANANYSNNVNKAHSDHKQIFKTPIYVLKNAKNDIFKLVPEHVAICEAIMMKKELQTTFIKNVRRSPNGETNLYFIRQMLAKINKLGFNAAITAIQKAKAKNDAKKAAKAAEVAPTAKKAPKTKKAAKTAAKIAA